MFRLTLLLIAALAQADDGYGNLLRWMDGVAQKHLSARGAAVAAITTVEQAESRKAAVRRKILDAIGGPPDYTGPLNASVTGRIEHDEYSIEKVVFESLPRLYVTANVYLPKRQGRHPGILLPLGHWWQGKPAVQTLAANLAMKGFVVLAITPRGLPLTAETRPLIGDPVSFHRAMLIGRNLPAMRAFDILRAFDLLASRADVDPARIGATASGTAGIWLLMAAAVEPRFAKL